MRDRTKQREEMEDVGDRYLAKGMKLKKIGRNKGRYIEEDGQKEMKDRERGMELKCGKGGGGGWGGWGVGGGCT
jgi:hypothetical protein